MDLLYLQLLQNDIEVFLSKQLHVLSFFSFTTVELRSGV